MGIRLDTLPEIGRARRRSRIKPLRWLKEHGGIDKAQ